MKQLAAVSVLIALLLCAPLQAQSPEFIAAVRASAEAGNAEAQNDLGLACSIGFGVPQDYAEAARWHRLAAEQEHAEAHYSLGLAYGPGRGVPQDYLQAHLWFNLAASRMTGELRERAVGNRDRAENLLTPDGLNEAQRLSREWAAGNFSASTDPPGRGTDPGPTAPLVQEGLRSSFSSRDTALSALLTACPQEDRMPFTLALARTNGLAAHSESDLGEPVFKRR